MLTTDPVCVRKIDSDRSCRIAVTCKDSNIDDLSSNTLYLSFLETRVNRRIILEPLSIVADEFGSLRCFVVLEIHEAFPCSLAAERVIVVLHKTVYKVDCTESILHPLHIVLIPKLQVTCPVVLDQICSISLLSLVLSHSGSLLKLSNDLLESWAVKTADLIYLLTDNTIFTLYDTAVKSIGNRSLVARINH